MTFRNLGVKRPGFKSRPPDSRGAGQRFSSGVQLRDEPSRSKGGANVTAAASARGPADSTPRSDNVVAHRWWILGVVGLAQLRVVVDATIVTNRQMPGSIVPAAGKAASSDAGAISGSVRHDFAQARGTPDSGAIYRKPQSGCVRLGALPRNEYGATGRSCTSPEGCLPPRNPSGPHCNSGRLTSSSCRGILACDSDLLWGGQ
jgi:hypothetical protein